MPSEEQSESETYELPGGKCGRRIRELEDEVLEERAQTAKTNKRILDLEKQLAETQHPGSNEAHVEATNNGDMHQEQNCRKRASGPRDPREEEPDLRDEDSSCSSVDWDYSNKKAELRKRRKYMDNESTSGQNQK